MYPFKECTHCDAKERRAWDDSQCQYCRGTGLMLRTDEENEFGRLLYQYGVYFSRLLHLHETDLSKEQVQIQLNEVEEAILEFVFKRP